MIELLGNGDNEDIAIYAKRIADSVFNWYSVLIMVENEDRLGCFTRLILRSKEYQARFSNAFANKNGTKYLHLINRNVPNIIKMRRNAFLRE